MAPVTKDPRFDIELTRKDLLDLSSPGALTAFFARLRYDTSTRTPHSAASLGLSDAVAKPIRRIEMIAGGDLFQVYLVELTSVTVAATRALARAFRDRAGDFLFVITSGDYSRLDFVLLDRRDDTTPSPKSIASTAGSARPRVLTVDRRNPSTVALRVLRRFTWTEPDSFAQVDKMLSAYAVAEWSEEEGLFNNRALFSDHYLKNRLREDAVWRDETPAAAYRDFRDLLVARTEGATTDETTLHRSFFVPALKLLGFDARARRRDPQDVEAPDYELYADSSSTEPLALCLTYPWMRYLDGKDAARDTETPDENPGAVVVSLLQKRDVPWVIVTNGKLWRLYSKRTHSRATSYFELDLEEVVASAASSDADPFRYFYLLFRCQAFELVAFTREGKEERVPFLDRLLLESADYAKELGERLKERIFTSVFPHLAAGFIARWEGTPTDEDLERTYRGTLTLLYRLLFLLYAEARDLLPVREIRGYFEKSLTNLKQEVAQRAGAHEDIVEAELKKHFGSETTELYDRLVQLFAIVDRGNGDLNVPAYNGGLFATAPDDEDDSEEAEAARFLRDHAVADRHLAAAIDLLSREDDLRTGRISVDYKSLGVRHLGSIYEGLLEFRLRFATERLGIVREKKRDVYKPWRELEEKKKAQLERETRFVRKGDLYLENDKHERKATGSYYTPDYIVKYIVEHAVGPVVNEKLDALRPRMREAEAWQKKQTALAKAKGEMVTKYEFGPAVESHWRELIDAVFDIKVVDPAMGSGHFLVEAVDFITDHVIDFLNAFRWNPVTAHLRYTRNQILESMQKQNVTIDPQKLTDVNLLKRHVLKRCIYGVDLNPMAVELAKVSLWLDCFTLGAPLSFLDHHLRCGNSLVGVTVEEVDRRLREGTQTLLFSGNKFAGVKTSVAGMIAVGDMPDITPDQVKNSQAEYKRAAAATDWAKRLLDVYTSQWFGNPPRQTKRGEVNRVLEFLGDTTSTKWAENPNGSNIESRFLDVVDTALADAADLKFFHWQLEFPEAFLGGGASGFDSVVGNPPYDVLEKDRLESSKPHEKLLAFVRSHPSYENAIGGKINLYRPFISRALAISRKGGTYSQIVPMSLMADVSVARLRSSLLDEHSLERVVAFPQKDDSARRVFAEAKLSTCIPVVRCRSTSTLTKIETYPWNSFSDDPLECVVSPGDLRLLDPICVPIPTCTQGDLSLALDLHRGSRRIRDVADVSRGEINQTVYRQYISTNPDHKPLLKGAELRPFGFNSRLSQGERQFFDEPAFEQEHSPMRPPLDRIATQRISGVDDTRRITCARSRNGAYFADSTNALLPKNGVDPDVLLGILNSDLLNWRFRITSTNNNVGTAELEMLPFPTEIPETVASELRICVRRLAERAEIGDSYDPSLFDRLNKLVRQVFGCA